MNITRLVQMEWGVSDGLVEAFDWKFFKYHEKISPALRSVFKRCSFFSKLRQEDDCCLFADNFHSNALLDRVGAVLCDSLGRPFWHIKTEWAKTFLAWDNLSQNEQKLSLCGGIYSHGAWRVREILRSESGFFSASEEWSLAVLVEGLLIPQAKEVLPIVGNAVFPETHFWLEPLRMINFWGSEGQSLFFRLLFSRREEFQTKMNARKFLLLKKDGSVENISKPSWA